VCVRLPFSAELPREEVLRRFGKSASLAQANARTFDTGRGMAP